MLPNSRPLAEYQIPTAYFEGIDSFFAQFYTVSFQQLGFHAKSEQVNQSIVELIQKQQHPVFLLPPLLQLIDRITEEGILEEYSLVQFELFLNQFSRLTFEENYRIRGKIMGKWVPREEYQLLFPISMGKVHSGSHYVTAHGSPDLDTSVASFWGWVDAFACRVSEGVHRWNVPEGITASPIEMELLFHKFFGPTILKNVAKNRRALSLSSFELMSQKGVIRKLPHETTLQIDQERTDAVLVLDEQGYYIGDWRNFDVEGVHHVLISLNLILYWFERRIHSQLISLFAKEELNRGEIAHLVTAILATKLEESGPAAGFTYKQKKFVAEYLCKVLHIKESLNATFQDFLEEVDTLGKPLFQDFLIRFKALPACDFSSEGRIFGELEKIIVLLDLAMQSLQGYTGRLDTALKIKQDVFGFSQHVLSQTADVEEIQSKMGAYPSLTVTTADKEGRLVALGVIHATQINKPILGTVTLRDFSNREETKIPAYFEVISVIDHHKSLLSGSAPAVIHISDGQSSNTLVAELAFQINDLYSTAGMDAAHIQEQILAVSKDLSTPDSLRILRRLLQKKTVAESEKQTGFFISKERESIEYLHFLYAILDDTDLLTKVAYRDILCMGSLLNRLKTLSLGKEVEVVSFDDLPRDASFVAKGAMRLLKHRELYSLYARVYGEKEKAIEESIHKTVQGANSELFADTKEQNGCARIGQTKLFINNFRAFRAKEKELQEYWLAHEKHFYELNPEYDLHLQMISTVASAEELFSGESKRENHLDELWVWIPQTESAEAHLKNFLHSFAATAAIIKNSVEVEFMGPGSEKLKELFTENFLSVPHKSAPQKSTTPFAILRYKAGSINSRKAAISPCLPNG